MGPDDLWLEHDDDLAVNWVLGAAAAGLDTRARQVVLADGRRVAADRVVVATGARARLLAGATVGAGVDVLRTVDDALALRPAASALGARLVVVGAGLIGGEVASTARSLGCEVMIVEAGPTPLAGSVGTTMGALVAELHAQNDVRVICGVGVAELVVRGRVEAVRLADGSEYPADVVVVGTGATPNVEWLAGSGVALGDGVVCDERGRTTVPGVVAVGGCASWHDTRRGRSHRDEHWTGALERPAVAVRALLAGAGGIGKFLPAATPFFWTEQHGVRIELAGHPSDADSVQVEEGSRTGRDLLAVYRRAGEPVAVLWGMNRGRQVERTGDASSTQSPFRREETAMTTASRIDGKRVAAAIKDDLAHRVQALAAGGRRPGLGTVLVGDGRRQPVVRRGQAPRLRRGRHRRRSASSSRRPATQAEIEAAVRAAQRGRRTCTGFIVQLPLPPHVDTHRVLQLIDPEKDADGLHPANLGKLVLGMPGPLPCTPRGIIELLREHEVRDHRSAVLRDRLRPDRRPAARPDADAADRSTPP